MMTTSQMNAVLLTLIIALLLCTCNSSAMGIKARVALVTGANKGIGLEIAKKLSQDSSFTTVLACRTDYEKVALELRCEHHIHLDLTDDSSIEDCRKYVEKTFGSLDVLINNAAICFNDPTLYGKVPHTPFKKQASITIDTNYFGTKKLTSSLLPLLEKSQSSARIINIASSAGRLGILQSPDLVDTFQDPSLTLEQLDNHMKDFVRAVESGNHTAQGWPNTCYGMSKVGIIAMTKVLARKYKNIKINSVDPGYCATDQNNHQGTRPAERGAVTPVLLATTDQIVSGLHWFDEKEMPWSYQ